MKKPWFRQKKYGYGWGVPQTWQGWTVFLLYLLSVGFIFYTNKDKGYDEYGIFINIVLPIIIATFILLAVTIVTSGNPKWRWGEDDDI